MHLKENDVENDFERSFSYWNLLIESKEGAAAEANGNKIIWEYLRISSVSLPANREDCESCNSYTVSLHLNVKKCIRFKSIHPFNKLILLQCGEQLLMRVREQ